MTARSQPSRELVAVRARAYWQGREIADLFDVGDLGTLGALPRDMKTTWRIEKLLGSYLLREIGPTDPTGIAARVIVTQNRCGSIVSAEFVAIHGLADRAHAIAAAARCYAQVQDTIGDLAHDDPIDGEVRFLPCSGGGLGLALAERHDLGATVTGEDGACLPILVYFGDEFVGMVA